MTRYLIIGNGAAGATAAETIRQQDPKGRINIVTAEPYPMYSRPGLAYVLSRDIPPQQVFARQPAWYERQQLRLIVGEAVSLDVDRHEVQLADGRVFPYDRLLIATGARAVPAPFAGAPLPGVVYLDTLDGTRDLLRQARRARRAVVVGGGITALELCEGLAHHGIDTHYFVRRDRLWGKVFNEPESQLLAERMAHAGVTIHYHTEATEVLANWRGRLRGVRLEDGSEFRCDLLGVAIGVRPQLDLVQYTPVEVDRAILVDETMQSSVPQVYAAGDCAQVYDRWTERHMLDILWPSAVAEGRVAGLNMAGGHHRYVKSSPFNACLLFGLHITAIGQVHPGAGQDDDDVDVLQHLSRGSSEVWYTFPRHYSSAWSATGPNTLRLVLQDGYLVGALLIGNQRLADPLRHLVEHAVYIGDWGDALVHGGPALEARIRQYWHELAGRTPQVAAASPPGPGVNR